MNVRRAPAQMAARMTPARAATYTSLDPYYLSVRMGAYR
ncbi:hypothetical protein C7412_103282 [Paraburkholderia silvatlantica]|nr:hypothetical protein C7412_103282 [Paraburkholderia silvatlantica]